MDAIGDGQKGQQAARKETKSRAKVGDSEKSCRRTMGQNKEANTHSQATAQESRPVVYALVDANGKIFYVGCTVRLRQRIAQHRFRLNRTFEVRILQERFRKQAPLEAERTWIRRLAKNGIALKNIRETGGDSPTPKRFKYLDQCRANAKLHRLRFANCRYALVLEPNGVLILWGYRNQSHLRNTLEITKGRVLGTYPSRTAGLRAKKAVEAREAKRKATKKSK